MFRLFGRGVPTNVSADPALTAVSDVLSDDKKNNNDGQVDRHDQPPLSPGSPQQSPQNRQMLLHERIMGCGAAANAAVAECMCKEDRNDASSVAGQFCEDSLKSWCLAHGLDDIQRQTLEALGATTYLDFIEMSECDKNALLRGLNLELVQKNRITAALEPEAIALFFECTDRQLSLDEYRALSNKRLLKKVTCNRSVGDVQQMIDRGRAGSSLSSNDSNVANNKKRNTNHRSSTNNNGTTSDGATGQRKEWLPASVQVPPHKLVVLDRAKAMRENPTLTNDDFVSFRRPAEQLKNAVAADGVAVRQFPTPPPGGGKLKVILVAGKTKSGKTSVINSFVNHLFGVSHEDKYRLKLVHEGYTLGCGGGDAGGSGKAGRNVAQLKASGTKRPGCTSKTNQVMGYLLECPPGPGGTTDWILIIDTPGFGDARGIDRNDEVVDEIRSFFRTEIGYVNAVWFVDRSSSDGSSEDATVTQRWMYETTMSMFGGRKEDDAASLLFTFSDSDDPPALKKLASVGLSLDNYFKINNAGFLLKESSGPGNLSSSFPRYENTLNMMLWDMSNASFESLVGLLITSPNRAFRMDKKGRNATVRTNREQLSHSIEHAWRDVEESICKLISLEQTIPLIVKARSRIEKNKFEVETLKYLRVRTRPTDSGTYSVICETCQCTCLEKCQVIGSDDSVPVMTPEALGGYHCKTCPVKCHWSHHRFVDHVWDLKEYKLQRNIKEMKQKYVNRSSSKSAFEQIMDGLQADFNNMQIELYDHVKRVQDIARELEKGSLPPDAFLAEYAAMIGNQHNTKDKRRVSKWRTGVLESGAKFIDNVGTSVTLFDNAFSNKFNAMMIEVKDKEKGSFFA